MTLVVFTHAHDPVANILVDRWADHGVRRITPQEIASRGWEHRPGSLDGTRLGGYGGDFRDVRAILTRMAFVRLDDLLFIHPEDRRYVAQEMTAFLCSLLHDAGEIVYNRPGVGDLTGPAWSRQQWLRLAERIGARVSYQGWDRWTGESSAEVLPSLTVIGGVVYGSVDPRLRPMVCRLAEAAGVALLTVNFEAHGPDAAVVSVSTVPDLSDLTLSDAALRLLLRGSVP